jgi:hypothetical protein
MSRETRTEPARAINILLRWRTRKYNADQRSTNTGQKESLYQKLTSLKRAGSDLPCQENSTMANCDGVKLQKQPQTQTLSATQSRWRSAERRATSTHATAKQQRMCAPRSAGTILTSSRLSVDRPKGDLPASLSRRPWSQPAG